MTKKEYTSLKEKILRGLELAHCKLVSDKKKADSKVAVIKNDKVTKVKPK
jgi:hypothetical protein